MNNFDSRSELNHYLLNAIHGERNTIMFYEVLKDMTADRRTREIISSIIQDEIEHDRAFTELYKRYFHRLPEVQTMRPAISSYRDGVVQSIMDELDTYEMYRDAMMKFPSTDVNRAFFEAMTDEMEHAVRFNYLYTKYVEELKDVIPAEKPDVKESCEDIPIMPFEKPMQTDSVMSGNSSERTDPPREGRFFVPRSDSEYGVMPKAEVRYNNAVEQCEKEENNTSIDDYTVQHEKTGYLE